MHEDIGRRVSALQGLAFHSLKPLLSWSDNFRVDEPSIDGQHQLIFELALGACELSREQANDGRLVALFDRFGKAIAGHFRYEEDLLAEIGYPGLDDHRGQHAAMLAEFEFVRKRLSTSGFDWPFHEKALVVLNFMLGVTVGHILRSDVSYAAYLQQVRDRAV